jgi:hypothetical protein
LPDTTGLRFFITAWSSMVNASDVVLKKEQEKEEEDEPT